MEGLLVLHNKYRSEYKGGFKSWFVKNQQLQPLTLDTKLMLYAQDHAERMTLNGKLKHSSKLKGLGFDSVGENIAFGQKSTEEVMNSWMNSRGHKKNILGSAFNKMGYSFMHDAGGRIYWCVVFGEKKV